MSDHTTPEHPPRRPGQGQTLTYLRQLFEERGLEAKNKLGQNFLIDLNLLDLVARIGAPGPEDCVLEIGTGTGSLTSRLVDRAGAVLSVEIDAGFHLLASETLEPRDNVILMHADALETKNELNSVVLDTLKELMQKTGTKRVKLIANLPYAVATPVISNLLLTTLPLDRMVVMVQWEHGAKLCAPPTTNHYGALSVLVQSLAYVELIRRVSPRVFWPRPKVDSAIVKIVPNARKRARVGDVLRFRIFLRDLYVHRRKNLRGALHAMAGRPWSKGEVDARLAALGIDGNVRAEDLDKEKHLILCNAFDGADAEKGERGASAP
jgi:16S rRNA (adenine1518-N6/adenine1519-N6)-dimethyltransferase